MRRLVEPVDPADLVGHATVALQPSHALIEAHVRAGHRLHGDDTTVPLLARGSAKKARLLTYVRHDRPWNGGAPPAAFFRFSRDRAAAKAINYMFEKHGRWQALTALLKDGRICLTNNAAEHALRGVALGRKSWLFAGSERRGERAAAMYTLIVTAKMNDIDPQAWLADFLARPPDMPVSRVHELLPRNWKTRPIAEAA